MTIRFRCSSLSTRIRWKYKFTLIASNERTGKHWKKSLHKKTVACWIVIQTMSFSQYILRQYKCAHQVVVDSINQMNRIESFKRECGYIFFSNSSFFFFSFSLHRYKYAYSKCNRLNHFRFDCIRLQGSWQQSIELWLWSTDFYHKLMIHRPISIFILSSQFCICMNHRIINILFTE